MKITVETRSDQLNAQDFLSGPKTFTVEAVKPGTGPNGLYDVVLQGETRLWRPPKTVIDVMNALWGDEDTDWMGKRVALYCEESVSFGKSEVGGIRVCGASGITEPKKFRVREKKMGNPKIYTIQPLPDAPTAPTDPAMISRDQWQQITTAAKERGIAEPLVWSADRLGRPLDGPQQITADEAAQLMNNLKEAAQ